MAYNYMPQYAPAYQNSYYQAQLQQPQGGMPLQQTGQTAPQTAPPSGGLIWVQGVEGAKSYIVAPNCTVPLFDTENMLLYIKSADISGMPSMRTFKIEEVGVQPEKKAAQEAPAISKEEFNTLEKRIEALEKQAQKSKKAGKEVSENEPTV